MPLKLASWNVNSIQQRLGHVQRWLEETKPDVVLLQEIKCETSTFLGLDINNSGYHGYAVGQKGYHGVAVLCQQEAKVVLKILPGDKQDSEARFILIKYQGCHIASAYVPNGNPTDSERFPYKLAWYQRLYDLCQSYISQEIPLVIGGDFNVIPTEDDVYDPKAWENDALFHPKTRATWWRLRHLGLVDAFRVFHPQAKQTYSFWDYQNQRWPHNEGLRIDHFLCSPQIADRMINCQIDKTPRSWDKPSDHTPIILTLD